MRCWVPVLAFLAAAAAIGVPVGWGIAAGWLCDCGTPQTRE